VTRSRLKWATAFLIGLATVTAALLSWRAAQIGSTAAYDDRQSISQTVKVEQERIDLTLQIASNAREYARYRADYGVAAALDREANRLRAAGADELARVSRAEALALRRGATRRAADSGVFGRFTIADDLRKPSAKPRPFDFDSRMRALAAEQSTALDSAGKLDPDRYAAEADDIRGRVNGLVRWAFVALIAVLLYTIAEVSSRRRTVIAFMTTGILVYVTLIVGALTTGFFG
jgi:hypothetical protein